MDNKKEEEFEKVVIISIDRKNSLSKLESTNISNSDLQRLLLHQTFQVVKNSGTEVLCNHCKKEFYPLIGRKKTVDELKLQ